MMLSLVAFVGEYRADAGHDREGGQEQPLEEECVVDVCRCGDIGHRHAVPGGGDMIFGSRPVPACRRVLDGSLCAVMSIIAITVPASRFGYQPSSAIRTR